MICKSILMIVIFYLAIGSNLEAQYLGGNEDGFSTAALTSSLNIYKGDNDDGFARASLTSSLNIHEGGDGDGYAALTKNIGFSIFKGNDKDGYATNESLSTQNIFAGGMRDGYNIGNYLNNYSIHLGGNGDGYNSNNFILDFVWTGNVSSNWNETGNWNTSLVPDITRRVIIPRVFTQFPILTGGILSVGEDPLTGDYLCRSLLLEDNATITLRSGAQLFNFNSMNIFGTLIVNNTSPDAVRNLNNGIIIIRDGGSFRIE